MASSVPMISKRGGWTVLAFALACTSTTPPPPTGVGTDEPDDAPRVVTETASVDPKKDPGATPPAAAPTPTDPGWSAVAKVCKSECATERSRITVFRAADGTAKRLRFDGDLERCSHPPRLYFDAAGRETLAIPEKPVTAGSAEAERFAAQQREEVDGLVEAETLGCPEPGRCKRARVRDFVSEAPCRTDGDCLTCDCHPVNRDEWNARGGEAACTVAGKECIATNPACCDGRCALAR
jgi:hypothetical protein